MICDECIHQWECWDQRGFCNQFKSREELRKEIEMLNQKQGSAISGRADKGDLQEARDRDLCSGNEGGRNPECVQTEACVNPETEDNTEKTDSAEKRA